MYGNVYYSFQFLLFITFTMISTFLMFIVKYIKNSLCNLFIRLKGDNFSNILNAYIVQHVLILKHQY